MMRTLPRIAACAAAGFAAALVTGAPAAAQTGRVHGIVSDSAAGVPVADAVVRIEGTGLRSVTDAAGAFRIVDVPAGLRRVRVSHLSYGDHTTELQVAAGEDMAVGIALSPSAILLAPLRVDVLSAEQRRARGSGARMNVVTRAEIEGMIGTSRSLADALRKHVAGVTIRRGLNLAGAPLCVEFRGASRLSGGGPCRSPAVYLDGVPIMNPTTLYETLDLRTLERIELLPPAEAGVLFGTGALYGALLIETRRPGLDEAEKRIAARTGFDWSLEQTPHRTTRVYLASLAGNALGLAAGLAAADRCIGLRQPTNDSVVTECATWPTVGVGVAALALPSLGSALGARMAGRTDRSEGRIWPGVIGATATLVPGYALLLSSRRDDSEIRRGLGLALLTLGVPLATTVADRLYRALR